MTRLDLRLGVQFPRFADGPDAFELLAASASQAERFGFDALFVMDHFWQLPMIGPPELPMMEGYLALAGLAARISDIQLGTLVTGVTYRNPALLAKEVTALDVISGGRAILGIGAAWYEDEHRGLGFDFPPMKERFERLEDALHICRAMFTEEAPSYEGRHHRIEGAINVPGPVRRGGPPILIGGSGERKTLRLVAEHADASNLICAIEEIPRKLEVLQRHCDDVGRDRAEINVSWLGSVVLADDAVEAEWKIERAGAERARARMIVGGPDEVREQVAERLFGAGLDGVIFNLPFDDLDDPDMVGYLGDTLKSL